MRRYSNYLYNEIFLHTRYNYALCYEGIRPKLPSVSHNLIPRQKCRNLHRIYCVYIGMV